MTENKTAEEEESQPHDSGFGGATAGDLKKLLEEIGFAPCLEPETLGKVFPPIKVAKPRGNFGKKKKA